jgi:hypothetical protein
MINLKLTRSIYVSLPDERPKNWVSHMMAPAPSPRIKEGRTEIFVGGWDEKGISSIFSFEFDLMNLELIPATVKLQLEKGDPGAFDENGVFPASVIDFEDSWGLSYTGFQLGYKIPHYNFGGFATRRDLNSPLLRVSKAPIIDRADEGLTVRAGLSAIKLDTGDKSKWISVYAAGSTFERINGKMRPNYSVYGQYSHPLEVQDNGDLKVEYNELEHGVGRPYITTYNNLLLLFYTRRRRDFSYLPGVAISTDEGKTYIRFDQILEDVTPRIDGQDDEMQYFPAPLIWNKKLYVFYNGNNFGQNGMGVWEFQLN